MGLLTGFLQMLEIESGDEVYDYDDHVNYKTYRPPKWAWDPRKTKAPIHDFRELLTAFDQMQRECADVFLYDTKQLLEKYNTLYHDYMEVKTALACAEVKVTQYEQYLLWSQQNQTATGQKNEIRQAAGLPPMETVEQPKENNKFQSKSGMSKKQISVVAVSMMEYGISINDIANELYIAPSTVTGYISTAKKHYSIMTIDGNRKIVKFDAEYDNAEVDLEAMYGEEWETVEEKPSNFSDTTSNSAGVIQRGILY